MKKLLITTTAIGMSVILVGCGTSASDATITSLSSQLDQTANTVSKVQTINPTSIGVSKSALEKIANKNTYYDIAETQNSLLNEENYKTEILSKTARIKKCLNKDIKLSKAQTSAIKELTSNLNKYTNSVSYSKNELDSTIKNISSMRKKAAKNAEKISANINKLACNSNARSCYYENIINTLDQIGCYFCDCNSNTQNSSNIQNSQQTIENNTNTQEKTSENKPGTTKNIDTYISKDKPTSKNATNNTTDNTKPEDIDPTFSYPARPTIYNRYNRYNQSRNTDTYGPMSRNIDTYYPNGYYPNNFNNGFATNPYGNYGYGIGLTNRYAPNGYYANGVYPNGNFANTYTGKNPFDSNHINRLSQPTLEQSALVNAELEKQPEQRLEDFEEKKDDNTIEKIAESKTLELPKRDSSNNQAQNQEKNIVGTSKDIDKSVTLQKTSTNNAINQKETTNEKSNISKNKVKIYNKDEFKPQTLEYIKDEEDKKIVAHNFSDTTACIYCFDINSKIEKMLK